MAKSQKIQKACSARLPGHNKIMVNNLQKTQYIYLGGSHKDSGIWRHEFQVLADRLYGPGKLIGTDPFIRKIDESDFQQIVERDIGIICDPLVTHVILYSVSHGAELTTGSACELMIAAAINKPTIVIRNKTNDVGPAWTHPFIRYFADVVVASLEEAVVAIIENKHLQTQNSKPFGLDNQLIEIKQNYQFSENDIDPFI